MFGPSLRIYSCNSDHFRLNPPFLFFERLIFVVVVVVDTRHAKYSTVLGFRSHSLYQSVISVL